MAARTPKTLSVIRTERIARDFVRVILGGDLDQIPDLMFTDHYVKLIFGDVTRTYTIRGLDRAAGELAIDFVVHGDEGLAGPWAANVQPGESISFYGPGGAYAPAETADVHLLAGDESAAPAIAVALDALPEGARAEVFIEVSDSGSTYPLRADDAVHTRWICRDQHGGAYGHPLAAAIRAAAWPQGEVHAFVHGNAAMVKDLRRYLFRERGLPRDQVSISGYWRSGHNEDAWQASKREFNAQVEAEEARLGGPSGTA